MTHREPTADLVLVGGRVETMDASRRRVEAVAVSGGRVTIVGDDATVRPFVGARTRVIALRGRTVTPGFGDAHVHPVESALDLVRCDLSSTRGLDGYLGVIRRYAEKHPAEPWVRGSGWSMDDFPGGIPDRADLDRVLGDRPACLLSRDGHTAWVDSAALARAGVTGRTPDPSGGRIERDADGGPVGALQETAVDLVYDLLPPNRPDEMLEAARRGQAHLHELGITQWQDARVGSDEEVGYLALAERGELTGRVVAALGWDDRRGLEQLEELEDRRRRTARAGYAPTSVKFFVDGVLENRTGAVLEGYLATDGRPTDDLGMLEIDPASLAEAVTRLDAVGVQAHFHAIGDRAVRVALDAVEAARRRNGPSDTRPHIAHLQLVHPDDHPRFRELGVVANAQAYWAASEGQLEHLTFPILGSERSARNYPFGSLVRAGARLAMGSDWSVSTADPLLQMEVAVERVADDRRGQRPPYLPDERLDPMAALAGFTTGTAWVDHLEAETGSLEVGKAADLVILDRDLFDRGAGAIGEARVLATFVAGRPVFERRGLD